MEHFSTGRQAASCPRGCEAARALAAQDDNDAKRHDHGAVLAACLAAKARAAGLGLMVTPLTPTLGAEVCGAEVTWTRSRSPMN